MILLLLIVRWREGGVSKADRSPRMRKQREKQCKTLCTDVAFVFFLLLNLDNEQKKQLPSLLPLLRDQCNSLPVLNIPLLQKPRAGGGGGGNAGGSPRATSSRLRSNLPPPPPPPPPPPWPAGVPAGLAAAAAAALAAAAPPLAIDLSRACGGVAGAGRGSASWGAAAAAAAAAPGRRTSAGWRRGCCSWTSSPPLRHRSRSSSAAAWRFRPSSRDASHAAGTSRSFSVKTLCAPESAGKTGERTRARNSVRSDSIFLFFRFHFFFFVKTDDKLKKKLDSLSEPEASAPQYYHPFQALNTAFRTTVSATAATAAATATMPATESFPFLLPSLFPLPRTRS